MINEEIRETLKQLYKEMSILTLPECRSVCRVPFSCCSSEYCEMAKSYAKERWNVELKPTGNTKLPFMSPTGCIVEPHLRPICTMHTCAINSMGCKATDIIWTNKYFALRDKIEELEYELT